MNRLDVASVFSTPSQDRPALLEGHWMGMGGSEAIFAAGPVSTIAGEARNFCEFPDWLARNAELHPEGGAIGYLTYELGREFETVSLSHDNRLPDFSFAYYPGIETLPAREAAIPASSGPSRARIEQDFDRDRFIGGVERIRKYIAAGDIYQANLTQCFTARLQDFAPEIIYARLAAARPPMGAFVKTPYATIISNSPERFFRVRGDRILASPIKGTLARSADPVEDARLRSRLLASAKDRAENVMIVDLLRNDLGRVCRYESIHARLLEMDELPHLFHLVSHVEGELRPGAGPQEILRALFPCGSITGAPKIRAMEILAEIERAPRGISMGAIGIIRGAPGSSQFEMDFSVAIRTITIRDGVAEFNVGCGIVYDSEPEAEYAEMLLKARPLVEALGLGIAEAEPATVAPLVEPRSLRS